VQRKIRVGDEMTKITKKDYRTLACTIRLP
jgi:hypothetical protein